MSFHADGSFTLDDSPAALGFLLLLDEETGQVLLEDADFERKHPREEDGKFGDKGGGGKLHPRLRGLLAAAKHYDTFDAFEMDWLRTYHGIYWHLTTDPNFKIDPKKAPRDASSMAMGGSGTPGLMVTVDIENWEGQLGTPGRSEPGRDYVAEIDLSALRPGKDFSAVGRGFGSEFFVDKPELAKVVRVLPIAKAKRISKHDYAHVLPQNADELRALWERAHRPLQEEWREEDHPRTPSGHGEESGRFTDAGGDGAAVLPGDPDYPDNLRDALDAAETPEAVGDALRHFGAKQVVTHMRSKEGEKLPYWFTDDKVISWDGTDTYPDVSDKGDWVANASDNLLNEILPGWDEQNEDFWASPAVVYHATPDDNMEDIKRDGLMAQHESRSLTNRGISSGVFTVDDRDLLDSGDYGDTIFEIDTAAMAREAKAGTYKLPYVVREPDIVEGEAKEALAHLVGLDDYAYDYDTSVWTQTWIFGAAVPAKYLKVVVHKGEVLREAMALLEWDEDAHPRGKTSDATNSGSFAPAGGADPHGSGPHLPGMARGAGEIVKPGKPPEKPVLREILGHIERQESDGRWVRNEDQVGDERIDTSEGDKGYNQVFRMGADGEYGWFPQETRVTSDGTVQLRDVLFGDWKDSNEQPGEVVVQAGTAYELGTDGIWRMSIYQPGDERTAENTAGKERMTGRGSWEPVTPPSDDDEERGSGRHYVDLDPADPDPEAGTAYDSDRQKAMLRMGITSFDEAGGSSTHVNTTYKATFEDGSAAIWKPRPYEDIYGLPDEDHLHEQAASDLAYEMKYDDIVPAAVARTIDGTEGSLQHWYSGRRGSYEEYQSNTHDRERALAFDYIIGNYDRHAENYIIGEGGRPILIDNGLSMPSAGRFAPLRNTWNISDRDKIPAHVVETANDLLGRWNQVKTRLQRSGLSDSAVHGIYDRILTLPNTQTWEELEGV